MKTQRNPVLFIFLGRANQLLLPFQEILTDYKIDGTAFIQMDKHFNPDLIKDEINRIQQELIQRTYHSNGVIRINYILAGDKWDLPALRLTLEKYIKMLYPSDILTDIYWLLDDASALNARTPERIRTMSVLDNVRKAQIYMMSNLDNNNIYTPLEDILRTIALLTLFKDCEPDSYPGAPDASRYNEFLFMENAGICRKGQHGFYTAGSRSLQIPKKELKGFWVSLLLNWVPEKTNQIDISKFIDIEIIPFSKIVDKDYFYGLSIPKNIRSKDFNGYNREKLIQILFGSRLNKALQIYSSGNIKTPSMEDLLKALESLSFYSAFDILSKNGWQTDVKKKIAEIKRELIKAEDDLKNWLDGVPDLNNKSRRLSLWKKQEVWPYELARAYLDRASEINGLHALKQYLQKVLDLVNRYYDTISGYHKIVKEAQNTLEWDTEALDAAFELFVPHVSEYFFELFSNYARGHVDELQNLTEPMLNHLKSGTFVKYVSALADFADLHLIPIADRCFADLLEYLKNNTGKCFLSLLTDWAVNGRRFGCLLKTGYSGLYTEASMYMPKENAGKVKAGYESRGLGRMNLFTNEDTTHIDIIYQAGIFSFDDLYYKDLYE